MEKKEGENNENRFIYFLDTHDKSKQIKVSLSPTYKDGEIEKIEEVNMKEINDSLSANIYRIKIIPEALKKDEVKKCYQVTVILEDEKGIKGEFTIQTKDIKKDFYEYNFKVEQLGVIPLRYEEEFEIYVEYLRKQNKKHSSRENLELILSTQLITTGPKKQYDFLFYMLIFLECYTTKFSAKHLITFKPERIKGLGKVSEKKLKQLKTIMTIIMNKPEKLHVENENDRERVTNIFYSVALFFNLNCNKELLPEMFKKEQLYDVLFEKLCSFKNMGVVIKNDILVELLKLTKNYEQYLTFLSYAGKDTSQFLQLINEQKEDISKIIQEEKKKIEEANEKDKKDIKIIEIENFVEPKKEDDLNKISELINQIYDFQSKDNKIIKFTKPFIEKYIELNNQVNLDNLLALKKIINKLNKVEEKFEFNPTIEQLIHDSGKELIKKGEIKNIKVLDFIINDDYYQSNYFNKTFYRPLDIFDGIDISSLEEDFFIKWKQINFYLMFDIQLPEFLKKISSLIKEMKDFELIYKFYDFYQEKDYKYECIMYMENQFIEIFNTYSPEKCPNFNKDVIKLIYLIDQKKVNIKHFLVDFFQKNLEYEKVNEIYLQLIEEHQNITNDTKDIIVDYFTKNKNNSNISNLIYLIKNCPKLRKEIFLNINNYIIKEDEFLMPEETQNYKFFKGLLKNNLFETAFQYKGENYISKCFEVISSLESKINSYDINYNVLSIFFQNEKNDKLENMLYERLLSIYLLDENKSKKNLENIKTKVKEVTNYIKDLESIYRDIADFFYCSMPNDIEKLGKLCYYLKNENLNYFEKNCKADYDNYKKYLKDAKIRENKKRSKFFNELFKDAQNKFKNDDVNRLQETEKNFEELRNLFKEKGTYNVDEKLLLLVLKPIRDDKESLKNELKILAEIFEIKDYNNFDKLFEEVSLVSKRGFIFNISAAINIFIQNINPKKTDFIEKIIDIINKMQEKNDIETIKHCYNVLNELKVLDEKDKDNQYINILMKFKEHPESILFLLNTSIQEVGNLQELAGENDSNYVTVNDIIDMGKCVEFFKDIGTLEELQNKNDNEVIELLKVNVPKKKGIFVFFEKYINNYNQIKVLKSSFNKTEVLKYKIEALLSQSKFILSNTKENSFICKYIEKYQEVPKESELTKENIISLREKALMSKKITPDYKYFIGTLTEILKISNILKEIGLKGYPKSLIVKVNIEINKEGKVKQKELDPIKKYYLDDDKSEKNYTEIIEKLNTILSLLNKKQIEGYKTKPLVRYIYGKQFNLLYNNFNKYNNYNTISLLKYITNDLYEKQVTNFNKNEKGDIIENNINDCDNYLKEILKINNLTLEKINQSTIISQKKFINKLNGVYTCLCDKQEKELFQIYKYFTGNNPIAQNVLICNKETSNEEIASFLYRAILHKSTNSCFIIAGSELMENEQKTYFVNLLNQFFPNGNETISSCLIILYTNKNSDLYINLEMKRYRKVLEIKKDMYDSQTYTDNNIEVIKSDKSGVGKSTQIKKDILDSGKKWIYFPLGGVLTREEIIKRLSKLNIDNKSVLHLDLYNTDQTSLMMEFLFSLLITKFYGENEDIFFFSKDIQIKVEIPNTFINFFEKFPILSLFKIREMSISKLAPLIVPKELESNIQIVANYLKGLKENKINEYDLIFPTLTPEIFGQRKLKRKGKLVSANIKAELLPDNECQKLIFESIKDEGIDQPTYYQIISFIDILAEQLKKFNKNFYLNAFELLLKGKKQYEKRTFIVKSFIKLTKYFTKGAFTDLIKKQERVHNSLSLSFGIYNEQQDINNAINDLADDKHKYISFDDIDPSLLFFHEGTGESFSIITNKDQNDKEYIDFLELKNTQAFTKNDIVKKLPDYKKYSQKQFLEELKNILDIKNEVEKEKKRNELLSLEEIADDYVFTADNFVKIILILLRIRSNIPVIMMGETGCGKTALIRKLSEMKNNGNVNKMKILNIHAGTSDNDIIHFLNKDVIPEAIKIAESEKEEKEKFQKNKQFFEETKIWVFFDEINTCKSMGLISELMCKHTCQGVPLPSNIVFIAACNPYRKRENKGNNNENNKIGLDIIQAHQQIKKNLNIKEIEHIKLTKNSNLVYTVNPLPHSLLNFVFDFGSLNKEDEKDYIRCIIKKCINKKYYKGKMPKNEEEEKNDEQLVKIKKLAEDMIIESQNFIREFSDKSAVSLREIRRFNIFYEFFYDYLNQRKEIYKKEKQRQLYEGDNQYQFYQNLDETSIHAYSINLSIFVCYYLRITDKEKRNCLYQKMNKIFKKFDDSFNNKDFLELPLREELFIVNNIKLDKGIAKNRALLENIFSLFVCINSKVPIFIVGKPGCSKSLSVQLIIKSMQGTASDKYLFKNLPKLMIQSYQGSMASTSKGVENIFKKARSRYKELSDNDKKENISLIFFDEMGLAENSPNNPLKVIHSELEYDQNKGDKQVAFIGISNWILDAAKMNRGISISIPEPDEDDNKETSLTIGKSYDEILANRYKNFFENLGKAYFEYKNYLKKEHNLDGKEDFHGNRDFYHLIKNSSRNIIEREKKNQLNDGTLIESAIDSIERNFSGIQFKDKTSLEVFKDIFKKMYPCPVIKEYDVLKRIKENINDIYSRYLLVVSKSSISTFLLSSILSDKEKDYSFYIGSQFEQDLNTEEYALKVLNKIQSHMERGNILILKNLESVYGNLYDLFNQNFTVLSNKKYARLAVGSDTNSFAYVNDSFRCIVSVDTDKIDSEEAPFLNRFEKHILSFDYLLNKELINESEKIKTILNNLVKSPPNIFKGINYDLDNLLINNNIEEIQALIYQANKEGKKKEEMTDYVLEKMALTLPQDIIVNMELNGFKQKSKIYNNIIKYYLKGEHTNFANFIQKVNNYKNVIYTFSNHLDDIQIIDGINNPLVGEIKKENIKEIKINSIKSENELEGQLDDFLNEKNNKICIVKLLPYEGNIMNYLKYLIEDKEKEYENKTKKVFIFIVYMVRVLKEDLNKIEQKTLKEKIEIKKKILEESLTHLSGYYQIFIDNLNGKEKYQINEILKMKLNELFINLVNADEILCSNIYKSTSYMIYNIIAPYKGISKENYAKTIIEFIYKNKRLRHLINECVFRQTGNGNNDIIKKVFKEKNILKIEDIEIISVIKRHLSKEYSRLLNLFYFKAEKDQFFSSLLSNALEEEVWSCKINDDRGKMIINNKKDEIEDKTIVEKIAKLYLDKIIFNDGKVRVTEKPAMNKIEINLGLKIPGIKPIFNNILKLVRENIIKNYIKNEKALRDILEEDEIDSQKNKYFSTLKRCNNSFINIINKEEYLKDIIKDIKKEEYNKLFELLINDYYTIFLNKNITLKNNKKELQVEENEEEKIIIIDNFDNNIRFLSLMTNMRNQKISDIIKERNNEDNIYKKLASIINWIESYTEEISLLQQIFLKLNMKIPNLNELIQEIIDKKQIYYEISERNPEYTSIVNEVFFLSLDSILRILTSRSEIYELPEDDFFDLINTNKEVLQDAMQLESILCLRSKETYSLQELLNLIKAFTLNKLDNVNNIKTIIQYFGQETVYINEKKENELCNNLNSFYKFLSSSLGKMPSNNVFNYYKILSSVFLNEYIKITFDKFRELELELILKNNDFIKNSSQLIKIILENILDTEKMRENLKIIKEEENENIRKLNNTQNDFLDEVLMNIFEAKIMVYFETILKECKKKKENETGILFNDSLNIFEDTIKFLDSSLKTGQKGKENGNNHLCKLYSIVYVKMYLSKLVFFINQKKGKIDNIKTILEVIKKIENKNFSKVIKIYFLKLFCNLLKDYDEFEKYKFEEIGINFKNEIKSNDIVKNNKNMLSYFLLPLDEGDYSKYEEELKIFMKNTNFDPNNKEIENLIEKDGIDIFLLITINKIISNLGLENYDSKDTYKKFSIYAKSLLSNNNKLVKNKELCNLLNLFYDSQIYLKKVKPKLLLEKGSFSNEMLEILLYGYRYCVNTLDNSNNNGDDFLYQSLLSKNCINAIEHSLIPGNDNKEDLHLSSLETINFHFNTFGDAYGCYTCSCGYYYCIEPCGFPTTNRCFNCRNCGEKLGWAPKKYPNQGRARNHGMVIRPGHYRIFKDKEQKIGQMKRWNDSDENIPNIILADYIQKVIEPIKKKCSNSFGFNSVSRDFFEQQNKKIRNLSNIGYRLINFISYSHLFFSFCLGNISEDNMKKYLIENMNILKIIETDWNLLKDSLNQKSIKNIQIFMNMIFKKLSKLIKQCKYLNNDNERINFENQVEKLINECINNYKNYSKKYNEENQKQSELDVNSVKALVTELILPNEDVYREQEYPMFKYFILTKYKSEEDMIKRMENKNKYPLLNQLIAESPGVKKLSNLPSFNKFINYMVDTYSFRISREDAKNKILNNEEIMNNKDFNLIFDNFLKSWDQIKSEAIKYKCRPEMPKKDLSVNDKLICFLNDNGELYNGMYLASASQNFIEWQNTFLYPIIDANNTFDGILHNYVDSLNKKIPINDAKSTQIVLIKESFGKSTYEDLNEIIYSFSERKIFSENGKINYFDYNNFVYDYPSIEEELGKIILPGVCLFEGEDNLNFITFWGEGFRGGRSEMISKFYTKYPQKDLNDEEKEVIIQYINKMNKIKMAKNNIKYDFKDFFGSMQMLIFYLTEMGVMSNEEKIMNILNNAPDYFKLSTDCRDFFYNEGAELTIKKLMNLFFFLEHLCYEDLAKTLQLEYTKEISEERKKLIKDKLLKSNNDVYTIKDLAAATRRLISRYLAGKMEVTDIKEDNELSEYLKREELWEERISKYEEYEGIIDVQLKEFNLKVGEAYSFYNLIGDEDKNSLKIQKG